MNKTQEERRKIEDLVLDAVLNDNYTLARIHRYVTNFEPISYNTIREIVLSSGLSPDIREAKNNKISELVGKAYSEGIIRKDKVTAYVFEKCPGLKGGGIERIVSDKKSGKKLRKEQIRGFGTQLRKKVLLDSKKDNSLKSAVQYYLHHRAKLSPQKIYGRVCDLASKNTAIELSKKWKVKRQAVYLFAKEIGMPFETREERRERIAYVALEAIYEGKTTINDITDYIRNEDIKTEVPLVKRVVKEYGLLENISSGT